MVDLSLVTLPVEQTGSLVRTDLASFREVPVCGSAYADAAGRILTLSQLAAYPLISLCRGSSTHQLYETWFRAHGLPFAPDIEAATSDQLLPMVRSGLGIGFLPAHTAVQAAADGSVHILQLRESPPERSICLLKRSDSPLSIAAEKLEAMLLQYAANNTKDDDTNGTA